MRLRRGLVVAVLLAAATLLLGRAVTALVVDHAWYDAMGAPQLFWERTTDMLLLQGIAWIAGTAFAFANLQGVRQTILAVAVPARVANIELTEMVPPQRLHALTLLAAAVIAFCLSLPLTEWTTVAMARHGLPFGEIEGILNRDLGFYVYLLPLEETAYLWALATLVVTLTVVLLLYALTRSLRMEGRRIIASTHVRRHLSVLGAIVLLLLAWSYRLDTFDLLQRGSGPDGLFLRIDHVLTLQVDRILVIVCAIAAPIFLRVSWIGQVRSAFVTLSIVLAVAIGGRQVLPILLTRSTLVGDPARRDQPYMTTRTLVSRRAYDVDAIRLRAADAVGIAAPPETRMALADLSAHVSLWEPAAARVRQGDGATSMIDAGASGWVSTPEGHLAALQIRRPPSSADSWSVSVTDVTQAVLRDSVLDGPVDRTDRDAANQPVVAPGLQGHRLVADPAGVLGTPMRGLGMRIAYAWAARDPSLLNADTVSGASPRLVDHRDVRERVQRLAPIFAMSEDVRPILADGNLLWAVNLYSASDHFPLSQRWTLAGEERGYFRFAATALVDAATGRVRFVLVDRLDPIARSWFARIPNLVVHLRELPARVVDQLPPATEGATAQMRTFARYGSRLVGAVARHLPDSIAPTATPPHLVRDGLRTIPAWSVPLLDGSDHVDGIITAVGGRYRTTVWDSTTAPRARWGALSERLRAALDSVRAGLPEGTRRDPRTRIGRGQMISSVEGPMLVQSLFWNRSDGAPMISLVGVLVGSRLALGSTLGDAVAALRGVTPSARSRPDALPVTGAARDEQIAHFYAVMRDAMRRGEWTRFGAAFDSLGLVVGKTPR